jgi:hypothetical protein
LKAGLNFAPLMRLARIGLVSERTAPPGCSSLCVHSGLLQRHVGYKPSSALHFPAICVQAKGPRQPQLLKAPP